MRSRRMQRIIDAQMASPFVKTCQEAMTEYLRMRAEGVPREQAIVGLEMIIREHYRECNGTEVDAYDWQRQAAGDES